jgi:hypothetical protein
VDANLARARLTLLEWLESADAGFPSDSARAVAIAEALTDLSPDPGQIARVRAALVQLLETEELLVPQSPKRCTLLAEMLAKLDPSPDELTRARKAVLHQLKHAHDADPSGVYMLVHTLPILRPVAADLVSWKLWATPVSYDLMCNVRRNSSLSAWLEILPTLAGLEFDYQEGPQHIAG